jgi:hypothetical protein
MTDQLVTLLRESGEALSQDASLEAATVIYRRGRLRHRRRVAAGTAAVAVVLGAAAGAVLATRDARPEAGQLATQGGGSAGPLQIAVETAPTAPAALAAQLTRCAKAAGAAEQAHREGQFAFTVAAGPSADAMLRCAQNQAGVLSATRTDDAGDIWAPADSTFTAAAVNAVPGTLRNTLINNIQTWLSDAHDGAGPQLCWGQADPFASACAGSVQPKDGGPAHPALVLEPPSENPRSRLIGGVVETTATGGNVIVRGERLIAAVEHYDQFPGYAVVVTQYVGAHVPGADMGPISFVPTG